MPETSQERTEEATPRRRLEARRKGTVARSAELNNALVMCALIFVLPFAIGNLGTAFLQSMSYGLREIPRDPSFANLTKHWIAVLQPSLLALLPIIGTAMIVGVASNFAQVGFVLSGEALQPKLDKLNPINGFKRIFSVAATVEGAKAALKSFLFGWLAWTSVQAHWEDLVALGYQAPSATLVAVGVLLRSVLMKVAIAWLVLAAIDYFYQRKRTNKQLMMTKQELKQEMKEAETSPELKAAQDRRRRRLAKGRLSENVKKADVIITNPTHYSIAIQYEHGKMHAPVVVAKGVDFLAMKIREIAAEGRIPMVPNPPLARALYKKCEVGDNVPRELFQAVAEVLAYVYRTLDKVRAAR
jgi:flagellar biosynthesis protein FlhB